LLKPNGLHGRIEPSKELNPCARGAGRKEGERHVARENDVDVRETFAGEDARKRKGREE